jgi:hypothetical protein
MGPESKMVLTMVLWTSICLLIVDSLEVLFVLILLGTLVQRELTDRTTGSPFKDRVNFFIYTFLVIFGAMVIRKVYLILQGA